MKIDFKPLLPTPELATFDGKPVITATHSSIIVNFHGVVFPTEREAREVGAKIEAILLRGNRRVGEIR